MDGHFEGSLIVCSQRRWRACALASSTRPSGGHYRPPHDSWFDKWWGVPPPNEGERFGVTLGLHAELSGSPIKRYGRFWVGINLGAAFSRIW